MILEVAVLNVRAGETRAFEASFREAEGIIASMPGYLSHELLARAPNYEIRESDARRNRTEFVQGWMELPATFGS